MKTKLLLITLLFAGMANAQIVNIPDANFKAKLLSANASNTIAKDLLGNWFKIDANNDNEIQESEALNVSYLDVNNLTNPLNAFSSIIGLEYFTNLQYFNCSHNQIVSLDTQSISNLQTLNCEYNQIVSLNVQNIANLQTLSCDHNQLTSLNVLGLINLQNLYCDTNQLNTIDISQNINLQKMSSVYNLLTSIDISQNLNLLELSLESNLLTSLDTSQNINIQAIGIDENPITSINLTYNLDLFAFGCYDTPLSNLNVTNNINLIQLFIGSNLFDTIDLSQNIKLEYFDLTYSNFTTIDLSSNTLLNWVVFENNPLLTNVYIKNGQNELFDNLNNPNLNFVCADDSQIISLQNQLGANVVVNSYCSFTPGGNYNTIAGSIIYDSNSNGCDALDLPQSNIRIDITDGANQGASFSNNAGEYNFYTETGNFTISPIVENPSWFTFNPITATIPFADNNNNVTTQNFCITPNGIHNDVEVVIMPVGVARPGFDAYYKIVFKNKGNQTLSGNIVFTYNDAILDFVSATQTPNSQSTGSISWNYSNLLPFENRSFEFILNVNSQQETPAVNNGDVLNYNVTINPVTGDEIPNDNIFTYNQTVVGSYDPNSVECLEGETVPPSLIGEYLHYAINFENLGTYQAENVVVKDVIDASKYDVNTLQMLNTSHEVYTRLNGNVIEFVFEDINLAAAAGNPPVGGHGTILFKIKSKPNLVANEFVTKTANIYFDYNFPISTNIETTTFAALNNSIFTIDESVSVYPNPTSSIININCNNIIKSIELYDVQGRLLQTVLENNMTSKIDISTKANGIYFLKINTDYGSKAVKIMKE